MSDTVVTTQTIVNTVSVASQTIAVIAGTQTSVTTLGTQGPAGPGLPAGGSDQQLVVKNGSPDYAFTWSQAKLSADGGKLSLRDLSYSQFIYLQASAGQIDFKTSIFDGLADIRAAGITADTQFRIYDSANSEYRYVQTGDGSLNWGNEYSDFIDYSFQGGLVSNGRGNNYYTPGLAGVFVGVCGDGYNHSWMQALDSSDGGFNFGSTAPGADYSNFATLYFNNLDSPFPKPYLTTAFSGFVLEQTGGSYGSSRLKIVNENGANGAIFETDAVGVVDFGFKDNLSGKQSNLRFETRSGYRINTTGDFQIYADTLGSPTCNAVFGASVIAFGYNSDTIGGTASSAKICINTPTPRGLFTIKNRTASDVAEVITLAASQSGDAWKIEDSSNNKLASFDKAAAFYPRTGSTAAGTAPIYFTSGTKLTTAAAGAMEYDGTHKLTQANALRYSLGGVIQTFFATVSNGSTVETDLFSYNSPGSSLAIDGSSLEFFASGTLTNNANNKTIKAYFASIQILTSTTGFASGAYSWELRASITRTSSTTSRCHATLTLTIDGTTTTTIISKYTAVSATFSAANTIKLTGQSSAASNDVSAHHGKVTYFPAP